MRIRLHRHEAITPLIPTSRHHETRTPLMSSHTPENAHRSLSTALKGGGSYVSTQIRFHSL